MMCLLELSLNFTAEKERILRTAMHSHFYNLSHSVIPGTKQETGITQYLGLQPMNL